MGECAKKRLAVVQGLVAEFQRRRLGAQLRDPSTAGPANGNATSDLGFPAKLPCKRVQSQQQASLPSAPLGQSVAKEALLSELSPNEKAPFEVHVATVQPIAPIAGA